MSKSPEQAIHDTLYALSTQLGYDTYNYLPANNVSYPFVFIGEIFTQDRHTKGHIFCDAQVTIHIYADEPMRNRRVVTNMREALRQAFYQLERTDRYQLLRKNANGNTFNDTSTGITLLHGILELDMTIN